MRVLLALIPSVLALPGIKYRAAVVEIGAVNARNVTTIAGATAIKLQNARKLELWTAQAASKGAQIVVFPEDFADSGVLMPPGKQNLFAEPLPSPDDSATLCTPAVAESMPLTHAVACAAAKFNITIATGMGDLQKCNHHHLSPFTNKPYPCDVQTDLAGYNAIGVFGPNGALLAKYRKAHLARSWSTEYEPQWSEVAPPRWSPSWLLSAFASGC